MGKTVGNTSEGNVRGTKEESKQSRKESFWNTAPTLVNYKGGLGRHKGKRRLKKGFHLYETKRGGGKTTNPGIGERMICKSHELGG